MGYGFNKFKHPTIFVVLNEHKNPGFDMPWHVATLKINYWGLIYHAQVRSVIARSSTVFRLDDVAISILKTVSREQ
jgi:hypothetical protein